MPAPKGRTVDGSRPALELASVGAALAGNVGQPSAPIEGGVLRRAEVGEFRNGVAREVFDCLPSVGGNDAIGVANRISEGNEVLFGHGRMH